MTAHGRTLARWMCALCSAAVVLTVHASPAVLTADDARHLLGRSGFAPTPAEVEAITGQPAERVVTRLVAAAQLARPGQPPPTFVSAPPPLPANLLKTRDEQAAVREQQFREGLELKTWWMHEMVISPTPLAERMTLFWHNHFATSQQKVVRSQAMWAQHQTLRAHALGDFRTLLHAMARDPAMLVYLDGANSRKDAPNENFAREVMELFTLGEATQAAQGLGGYTEPDIREAARAFTGWSVDRRDFTFLNRPAFHDTGTKTLFGRTGAFDGDAVLDLLLAQPAAARFVVGKLWKEFVSPAPAGAAEQREFDAIAARFRDSGYDTGVAVRGLLLSDAFWAPSNRGALVKSPIDLVVGTVRQFGFGATELVPFVVKAAQLGQNLLAPPNVKGWPGYTQWIDATTLLERKRFTEQLFRAVEIKGESRMAPIAFPASGEKMGAGDVPAPAPMARGTTREGDAAAMGVDLSRLAIRRNGLPAGGRDGLLRVGQGMAKLNFDPDAWLAHFGGHADRVPTDLVRMRIEQALLPLPPTQAVPDGSVGVAYLRALTLDPAYQLK
jgi:uncharacterized protein (DUF1800 family)